LEIVIALSGNTLEHERQQLLPAPIGKNRGGEFRDCVVYLSGDGFCGFMLERGEERVFDDGPS